MKNAMNFRPVGLMLLFCLIPLWAFAPVSYTHLGSWVGAVDPKELPVEMWVDWVKYYEKR